MTKRLLIIFFVFMVLKLFSCKTNNRTLEEIFQINTKIKEEFDPCNYKGYGYVFFSDDFIDGRTMVTFIPVNKNSYHDFLNNEFNSLINNYPIINIEFGITEFSKLKYDLANKINSKNLFCFFNSEPDYYSSYKWRRVYVEYEKYKEDFEYDQFDGKSPHGKIAQSYECFSKWLRVSDTSKLKCLKIID